MNVPSLEERQAGWRKIKIKTMHVPYWPENALWRKLIRKAKWVLIIIVAPEVGVGLAASQRAEAESQLAEALEAAPGWDSWLTMSHAFYATMGGIVTRAGDTVKLVTYGKGASNILLLLPCATVGFKNRQKLTRRPLLRYDTYLLVRCLQRDGFKPDDGEGKRPSYYVSEADIANLSKSDTLTKVLAIGQSLYLAVQCIARRRVGLAYSLLELSTALYIVCAAAMYWLWREKPYDAQTVTVINKETTSGLLRKRIKNLSDNNVDEIIFISKNKRGERFPALLQYAIATLFGGLHLLAWNWTFPDPKSLLCLWLWRGSSLGMAGLPLTLLASMAVAEALEGAAFLVGFFGAMASLFLYPVCHLFIIGLVVYSLSHMPSGVYDIVPWTAYFPSIS